jgi:hypothetical protein
MFAGGFCRSERNEAGSLHNPPQLVRLVVCEFPGFGDELCSRDWTLLLILKIVEPRHEPTAIWLSIHHPEACARHRHDDVSIPCFDAKVLHPVERERGELRNCERGPPQLIRLVVGELPGDQRSRIGMKRVMPLG